ncbi:unnamed protein product [Protopolystoma xenopodis]|uniref:Aminopeptidase N-like N-terminal domain-containing protein n=1 Tax=Protopolystoma xenopodis TaxID=117903 RepID=A0A448WMD9_9PLAT|nr:unnamed protein product [Protopolystoma xenopodis]
MREANKSSSSAIRVPQLKSELRLPKKLIPHLYQLTLQAHIHGTNHSQFFFNGSVTIRIECKENTNILIIHSIFNLSLWKDQIMIFAENDNKKENLLKNMIYVREREWQKIDLTRDLKAGQFYIVIFKHFSAKFYSNLYKGWYLSHYIEGNKTEYLATSQLQPTDARRVFPCFDEPSFKAQFELF